jgi:hypothetical protein
MTYKIVDLHANFGGGDCYYFTLDQSDALNLADCSKSNMVVVNTRELW